MRAILPIAVLAGVTASSSVALAQISKSAPPPVRDIFSDNKSTRFAHWSAVVAFPAKTYSLRYAVCNMNTQGNLYFLWDKPGFGTGWTNSLPVGTCGTLSVDSAYFYLDPDSPIVFAQNNQIAKASAYLSKPDVAKPSSFTLQTSYVQHAQAIIVDFSIRMNSEPNGQVTYAIRWSQGVPEVAFSFDLPESIRNKVVTDLQRSGVRVAMASASDLVSNPELERLTPQMRDTRYLRITADDDGPGAAIISYMPERREVVRAPVLLIDGDRRIIGSLKYDSVH